MTKQQTTFVAVVGAAVLVAAGHYFVPLESGPDMVGFTGGVRLSEAFKADAGLSSDASYFWAQELCAQRACEDCQQPAAPDGVDIILHDPPSQLHPCADAGLTLVEEGVHGGSTYACTPAGEDVGCLGHNVVGSHREGYRVIFDYAWGPARQGQIYTPGEWDGGGCNPVVPYRVSGDAPNPVCFPDAG